MRAFGRGIAEDSQIYLYEASPEAKRLYFYALCLGHYHCNSSYLVNRQAYNSYLLLFVADGTAFYTQDGVRHELRARDFALIDCYRPHIYGSTDHCELYWVHLDGPTAREIFEKIALQGSCIPRHYDRCRNGIISLCRKSEERGHAPEAEVNRVLTSILMEFLLSFESDHTEKEDVIEEVQAFIDENPEKELDLRALAERAKMSPYYFLRCFKEKVGMTPYDYLLHARLNVAYFYLISSDYSVKEIAYSCGFGGVSNFCTCFKKHTGVTPSEYRQMHTDQEHMNP